MKIIKQFLTTTTIIILLATLVTSCNTMHGVGRDVQAGGRALAHAADDA